MNTDDANKRQPQHSPGSMSAIKMPHFPATTNTLPQLSEPLIYRGGMRIKLALEYMHGRQLVHADVKLSNIVVDQKGLWRLGTMGPQWNLGRRSTRAPR